MKRKNLLLIWRRLTGNSWTRLLLWILFYIPVYAVLYKIYIPKIAAFGCFDDCPNYVAGYFLNQGKHLYSQVYYNHQPLAAYISFLVQHFHHAINIFALILMHRQLLLAVSFCWSVFLSWRFGSVAMVFSLIYEFSKFYVFGDRFLAEGFIIYPLVYLVGVGIKTLQKQAVKTIELLFCALCTWFVIFMREPYVPLVCFVFFIILYPSLKKRSGLIAIGFMVVLTALLFSFVPIGDYFYTVFINNSMYSIRDELSANQYAGIGIVKSFFYFLYIFFAGGTWNDFRIITALTSVIAIFSAAVLAKTTKRYGLFLFLFVVWGLANIRVTEPGVVYFEAFHMLVWYGLFIFTAFFLLREACSVIKRPYIFWIVACILIGYTWFSPRSFIYQKVDGHTEFITNYGRYLQIGEVIRAVTTPDQTLFTHGAEEFLYVESERPSRYRYAFYYPHAENDRYDQAYHAMLAADLPDVYYDFCTPDAPLHPSLASEYLRKYTQFYSEGKPTCLYIKTSLVEGLTAEQREKIKEFRYDLP